MQTGINNVLAFLAARPPPEGRGRLQRPRRPDGEKFRVKMNAEGATRPLLENVGRQNRRRASWSRLLTRILRMPGSAPHGVARV